MSALAWLARAVVKLRFGETAEFDIVSDYLELDTPDRRGAWRAWQVFAKGSK